MPREQSKLPDRITVTHERQQLPSPPMKHKNEEANNENRNNHGTEAAEQKE